MTNQFNYWQQILADLQKNLKATDFQAWFSMLEFKEVVNDGRKIILIASNDFSKNYIQKKFQKKLLESVNQFYPKVIHIELEVQEKQLESIDAVQAELDLRQSEEESASRVNSKKYLPKKTLNNLNPKYDFDSFVVAKYNEFVTNVAQGVCKQLGTLYNPLFIHSPVGLGKTHILQAIGGKVLEEDPSLNIKYVPSETFFNQYYLSLRKKETEEFRNYYHNVDVLLIDDIQFIGGKDSFQQILFHIFNHLHQNNQQIIITSDVEPKSLIGVEDRLVSRFEWGMVVDIPKPDLDDRRAIIQDKLERLQIIVAPEHVELIAQTVDTNVREIEGVLNKIKAMFSLSADKELSDNDLSTILSPFSPRNREIVLPSNAKTPDNIIATLCKIFALDKNEIIGSSRKKDVAFARQIGFWLYKKELNLSYPMIGKIFGGRDHSTVHHGCKKIDNLITENDKNVTSKIELAKNMLLQA